MWCIPIDQEKQKIENQIERARECGERGSGNPLCNSFIERRYYIKQMYGITRKCDYGLSQSFPALIFYLVHNNNNNNNHCSISGNDKFFTSALLHLSLLARPFSSSCMPKTSSGKAENTDREREERRKKRTPENAWTFIPHFSRCVKYNWIIFGTAISLKSYNKNKINLHTYRASERVSEWMRVRLKQNDREFLPIFSFETKRQTTKCGYAR